MATFCHSGPTPDRSLASVASSLAGAVLTRSVIPCPAATSASSASSPPSRRAAAWPASGAARTFGRACPAGSGRPPVLGRRADAHEQQVIAQRAGRRGTASRRHRRGPWRGAVPGRADGSARRAVRGHGQRAPGEQRTDLPAEDAQRLALGCPIRAREEAGDEVAIRTQRVAATAICSATCSGRADDGATQQRCLGFAVRAGGSRRSRSRMPCPCRRTSRS